MSNPVSLIGALFEPPSPIATCRSDRSSMSDTRRSVIPAGDRPATCPRCTALSVSAASKLCADATACASPVKWMFTSSSGSTRAMPPPVPPPLIPNIGPSDGSRSVAATFTPSSPIACAQPHRRRRLALARRRRRHPRHDDQLPRRYRLRPPHPAAPWPCGGRMGSAPLGPAPAAPQSPLLVARWNLLLSAVPPDSRQRSSPTADFVPQLVPQPRRCHRPPGCVSIPPLCVSKEDSHARSDCPASHAACPRDCAGL